jgi:trafficking protein particle complex subunit 2
MPPLAIRHPPNFSNSLSQNNPLHISIFPTCSPQSPGGPPTTLLTPLQTSLLLSSTLDIFEARARANALTGQGLSSDYGLLKNVDERLAMFGWETNTGVRFVVGVDMRGSGGEREEEVRRGKGVVGGLGLRDGEMKVVSWLRIFEILATFNFVGLGMG